MRGNRKARGALLAAVSASLVLGGSALAATGTFTVTGTTMAALSVSCGTNLRFGTIAVEPTNALATITVNASAGATATSSSIGNAYAAGGSGPGACTIANETGADATASLSAATGVFAGTTLSGVSLSDGALGTLLADVTLSKATGIGNETIYIGGALTIPALHTSFGNYTGTITITVTD